MKIGLIAMSGIRVCDQELLELGLTFPGVVERSKVISSMPSLGLLTLAGMTPEKHKISYIESEDIKDFSQIPTDFDLVGISTYSAQIFEAYELSEKYRKAGVAVVMGGPHVSLLPEEAALHCDCVVIGEGELHWLNILEDFEAGKLNKFYGKIDNSFDFKNAPMPAYELLDLKKYNRLTVQTSRGCPHLCSFCGSSTILSNVYKQKPIEKVLAEIDKIRTLWKKPFIELADDNSFVNRNYWKQLLPQIAKRRINWFTETDISIGKDKELLKLLKESRCAEVLIGLESPNQSNLNNLEVKNNWKFNQWKEYKRLVRNIQSFGIRVNGCFILGLDNQDENIFDEVFNFANELEIYDVQITVLTPFPNTILHKELIAQGRMIEDKAWQKCTLFDLNFVPQNMSVDALKKGFKYLSSKLYSDEQVAWRRRNFEDKYLLGNGELFE